MTASGLRVIAGSARGRRIATPPGSTTRPMTDRVRESVFSALDARGAIVDAAVLDLYCGSGVLAIEALSRGAARAVLVDRDLDATEVAAANLESLGLTVARVERRDVAAFVRAAPHRERFDLVFVDPPYALGDDVVEPLIQSIVEEWVEPDATLVVHRRAHAPAPPPGWMVGWERTYGDTLVALIEAEG